MESFREICEKLNIDKSFLSRDLNFGFSGGEKKKNEIFHMLMIKPTLCILDEIDSGLDIGNIITHKFHYSDFTEAFDLLNSGKAGKVILDWS